MRRLTVVALLLAGCGGGSEGTAVSPSPAAPPVAAAPSPTPPPAEPPAKAPEPAPIPAAPKPPPAPEPPAPEPPAASPPPERPFVYGYLVKAAINSAADFISAYEVNPVTGLPDTSQDRVLLAMFQGNDWEHRSQPQAYRCPVVEECGPQNEHAYPFHGVFIEKLTTATGEFALGASALWSIAGWQDRNPPLWRDSPFVIRDNDKLTLNTTIAQWRAEPNFVQLQVSTFDPSNTVFRLCLHLRLDLVRRLACTLHDKDTALLRGAQILDDSAGLGGIEYRTPR